MKKLPTNGKTSDGTSYFPRTTNRIDFVDKVWRARQEPSYAKFHDGVFLKYGWYFYYREDDRFAKDMMNKFLR